MEAYVAERIALVRAGDTTPIDLHLSIGETIRFQCAALPEGGRTLTYTTITDLVRKAAQMQELATTDSLTGLFNRRQFTSLVHAEWDRFRRYQRPLSLITLDIDRFKSINDRFGHSAGDRVLAKIADICREGKRGADVLARVGGEEFALILPETQLSQAVAVAERLRHAICRHPLRVGGVSIDITASLGVAEAQPVMNEVDDLIERADQALYAAKRAGRNRVSTLAVTQIDMTPAQRLAG
jgi:diguanylate cyclase (GGDEF)-like protein